MGVVRGKLPLAWDRAGDRPGAVVKLDYLDAYGWIELITRIDEQRDRLRGRRDGGGLRHTRAGRGGGSTRPGRARESLRR
jgi:hypothetical protein